MAAVIDAATASSDSRDDAASIAPIPVSLPPSSLQRVAMDDPDVQPLARAVYRVHVIEESRHISFARDELARRWVTPRRWS